MDKVTLIIMMATQEILVTNSWAELPDGSWMYLDNDGNPLTGQQKIDGQSLYFNDAGKQIKNALVKLDDGSTIYLDDKGVSSTGIQRIDDKIYYFDPDGKQVVCRFEELPDGSWMYLDDDGVAATGAQKINGQELYFDNSGKQVKNDKVINDDGTINYYTGMSGEKLKMILVNYQTVHGCTWIIKVML